MTAQEVRAIAMTKRRAEILRVMNDSGKPQEPTAPKRQREPEPEDNILMLLFKGIGYTIIALLTMAFIYAASVFAAVFVLHTFKTGFGSLLLLIAAPCALYYIYIQDTR